MNARPWLLDLYGCQGGATAGYQHAGWTVHAVDTAARHARYNPAEKVIVGDALAYLDTHGHRYQAIHASPPCQYYTRGNARRRGTVTKWERTIPATREALDATGRPYVIENVKDAGWDMLNPVTLCGCMFSLTARDTDGTTLHLRRPRLFEAHGFDLWPPWECDHSGQVQVAGVYGGARRDKHEARHIRRGGYVPADQQVAAALLGITHPMTWEGLMECLPPAYTEHIGRQILAHLEGVA